MFKAFLVKEIRERRGLLAFAFLLIFGFLAAFLAMPRQAAFAEVLAIALSLAVLPLIAVLLGASAFDTEFRDGAWVYLASRPVSRAKIWLMKYLSLAIIGLAVFLAYLALLAVVPTVRGFLTKTAYEYASVGRISVFFLGLSLYLLVFHVAFSLSFLSGKPFQVVFISLFVVLGVGLFFYLAYLASQMFYPYIVGLNGVAALVSASFAGASLLVFRNCDFSQPRKKAAAFLKYVSVFLLISLAASAAWTRLGGRTIGPGRFIWNVQAAGGDIFFTSNRGIFIYDPAEDAVRNLAGRRWLVMPFSISFGGEKVLFLNYRGWRGMSQELWAMNRDGLQRSILADAGDQKSPFFEHYLFSARLSTDGTKAALVTLSKRKKFNQPFPYRLWWMNADGTDIRSVQLGEPLNARGTIELMGWTPSERYLLLYQFPPPGQDSPGRLFAFDFASQACGFLAEGRSAVATESFSPGHENLLFYRDDGGRRRLALLDLETFEVRDIFESERLRPSRYRWSPDGQRILFFSSRPPDELTLNTTSLLTGAYAKISIVPEAGPNSPLFFPYADWACGGSKIALVRIAGEGWQLSVLSADLKEERVYPIPKDVQARGYFAAAGDKVLAESRNERGLWRCDLGTGDWKKVY